MGLADSRTIGVRAGAGGNSNAETDRACFRDVIIYPHVDAGHAWLIFALPPTELAMHPADANGPHEPLLICDDVKAFVGQMPERGVVCSGLRGER
jgi:hypothetical protein